MAPVVIPEQLPAGDVLRKENIFVMNQDRALHQDIRPLQILIVNLMPLKEVTEAQLLRLLGNTLLQVEITLLRMASHDAKNTDAAHLNSFYHTLDDVKAHRYDAMIVTGAPVETLPYERIHYWDEFLDILSWAKTNVFSSMYLCWAAQAALHVQYGVGKRLLPHKRFGVFSHTVQDPHEPLFRGYDDTFYAPHSRHTELREEDIGASDGLDVLSRSEDRDVYIAADRSRRHFYVTGHPEYDRDTLAREYRRDVARGAAIDVPRNYFEQDDPERAVQMHWKAHAHLLFANWLNYYVYQMTDYDFTTK